MAIVELGVRGAAKLLETGRVKIGWVYGSVRRMALVMCCYACFGFAHRQADCVGPNRRKAAICIQCGCAGHLKKDCQAEPRCFICEERGFGPDVLKHIPGSGICAVFRQALGRARSRLGR